MKIKISARLVSMLAVAATLTFVPKSSNAQQNAVAAAINSYLAATWGATTSVTILGSNTTCPVHQVCLGYSLLVTYTEGDGEGQAVLTLSDRCPTCYTVLVAGGGQLDLAGVESLGFGQTEAQMLVAGNQ
jgi:hypothetical protein